MIQHPNAPENTGSADAPDYASLLTCAAAGIEAALNKRPDESRDIATSAKQAGGTMPTVTGLREPLIQVAPHIFRIDLPVPQLLGPTNSYVVMGGKNNLIIDSGCNLPETKEAYDLALSRLDIPWKTVDMFLTHSDWDHIAGLNQIARQGMIVYGGIEDLAESSKPIITWIGVSEITEKVNRTHGIEEEFDPDWWAPMADTGTDDIRVTTVEDGNVIDAGDFHFECIATPGHNPFHMCLYEPTVRILVAGDHILGDTYSSVSPYDGSDALGIYLNSLDRVRNLPCDLVLTGHGPEFTDLPGRVDEIKAHCERDLDSVRAIIAEGISDPGEIAYASSHGPHRRPWEKRTIFGQVALVGQTMGLLRHLAELGEYDHPELVLDR